MIKIALIKNLYCPIVTCDACGNRIDEFADGSVLYRMPDPLSAPYLPLNEGELFFTHKRCNHAFEHYNPANWFWDELGPFILQLGFNTQMWTLTEARTMHKEKDAHRGWKGPRITLPKSERIGKLARRFRIFQRDGYRCQVCGRSATEGARLEVGHKHPRARGGDDSEGNLWTLCFDCNRGKGVRPL